MTMLTTRRQTVTDTFGDGVICQLIADTTLTTEATRWVETVTHAIALSTRLGHGFNAFVHVCTSPSLSSHVEFLAFFDPQR